MIPVREPCLEHVTSGSSDAVRLLGRVDLRLRLLTEPRSVRAEHDGHDLATRRRRPLRADDRDDPSSKRRVGDDSQGILERILRDIRHRSGLDAVSGETRLGQTHDPGTQPTGLLHRGDGGRNRLVERRCQRRGSNSDANDRHFPSLPG